MALPPQSSEYTYANNSLKGKWHQFYLQLFDDSGFRAIGSAYDPVNNEIYAVSHPGHLYKINENASVKWSFRNNKKNLSSNDLNGVNLANGSFRLLHQKGSGGMEFSDDEEQTWSDANGAYFENNWNFTTLVTKKANGKRIVAHGARYVNGVGYHRIYISTDYGINYSTSLSTDHLKVNDFDVRIVKPHNSKSIFCFARRYSDNKIFMYRMYENNNDLIYIGEPITLPGMGSIKATLVNNPIHMYLSYGNTHIYYSNNGGYNWSLKNSQNNRDLLEIHPTQPNVCFRGFYQTEISTDYGVNWSNNQHRIGPSDAYYIYDLRHFKTYDKDNGGNLTYAGYDFGSYYSTNLSSWSSWVSINLRNPTMMSYDASTNETNNRVYSANQDRGTQSFTADNGSNNNFVNIADREGNTDNFRVTVGNNDGVWLWYYYGSIGRASLTNGGNYNTVVKKSLYSNWVATSIIPSPDTTEDAVYIPWGNRLNKLTFANGSITRTYHPYTFTEAADCFGYSKLNTNRWYAGLRSGPIMYSTDGGTTFNQSSYSGNWPTSTPGWHKTRAVIATSPIDEATVYYAGAGNTFLISTDGGANFTKHANGLNVNRISDLDISANGKYIFAACYDKGAWVYSVDNDTWYKMDGDAVPNDYFTSIQFIDNTETARYGTFGSGIIDFNITNGVISTISDGLYTIELDGSGKCMTVERQLNDNGTLLRQWTCSNFPSQQFKVTKQSNGSYEIATNYNNKLVTVNLQPDNGTNTYIWQDENQSNQRFNIESLGSQNYRITPSNSTGKALAIRGNELNTQNARLTPWTFYNNNNFRWKFKPVVYSKEGDVKSGIQTEKFPVSIEKSFKVYPNPAAEDFNILLNNFEKADITISNVLGKVIYKTSTRKNKINISKSEGFKSGIYLVSITDEFGNIFKNKIIVK